MICWEALTTKQLEVLGRGELAQFRHQPRFANAGFPGKQQNTSLPMCSGFEAFL